jgi:hypothetical protein
MSHASRLAALLVVLLLASPALSQQAPTGGIEWQKDLTTGLEKAKETGKVLMICINATYVDGKKREEPAAKGLREVVYRDPKVVEKSREFVCVFLTPRNSTADYGELGNLGMEGEIISPQHIFVNSAGTRILLRREYWSHGQGEKAVEALLAMMDQALKSGAKDNGPPVEKPEGPEDSAAARTEWIAKMIQQVQGTPNEREAALVALLENDQDGDCTNALIALLPENKKNVDLLWSLIRALGRNGLEAAAIPVAEFLDHRDATIRANAAVSLEYIGSHDKKVVAALSKAAAREKEEGIANHMFRALGRCGVKDSKARGLLLKMVASAKSEFASFGPAIGLAYFEGDSKAARGVEKLLKQLGMPGGGRRGWGGNNVKRAVLCWTLASIGDKKSGRFMRDEMIAKLENNKAFWVEGVKTFWEAVARQCEGDGEDQMGGIVAGVRVTNRFSRRGGQGRGRGEPEGRNAPQVLMDEARNNRDTTNFRPKGDNLLQAGQ